MTTTLPTTTMISFRAGSLAGPLAQRGAGDDNPGAVAKLSLERYFEALDRELRVLALTHAEAGLLADACRGTLWEPHTVPLLWAEVDEAIRNGDLAAKWGVPGAAFVARLRALTYTQALAVADGVERFWRIADDDVDAALRKSGLTG
ncbi:MAG: hypothetical protein AB7R89_28675 [Dehalococcoidia bacterium]